MQIEESRNGRGLYVSLAVLGTVIAFALVTCLNGPETASAQTRTKGIFTRTESFQPGIENYDIRTAKHDAAVESLLSFRASAGVTAFSVADGRDEFVRAENSLRARVPNLRVSYNKDLHIPEVISPDVWKSRIESLAGPTGVARAESLRNFVRENNGLVGLNDPQADSLKVTADYMNPSGNMGFAHLEQRINGVPVFRGEIKAGFRKDGSLFRVVNNLAPGLDYSGVSKDFGEPLDAVKAAARYISYDLQAPDVVMNAAASDGLKTVFGEGDWATTAEKMYFPIEYGVARPAWRVLIWQPVNAYYVIVDAETGTMLWRKNITQDQTQSATYEVYINPNSMVNSADSPAPLKPGPTDPTLGTQGALITRTNVSLIGNEGDLSFNNNGWITDGANGGAGFTDGNNVQAGVDLVAPNGVDAPVSGVSRAFSSAWNPPPGNPGPGDDVTTQQARDGAVIQMFYVMNRYHDALYKLGFTEKAGNFQQDNFGRGGLGADRISAEGQDSSGTNNANFSTPADGGRGRMQMYRFTGTTPQRDGTTDVDIIFHEATHGTSNRLHGNSSGLSTNLSGAMGEGWSDFYAFALLSSPTDPVNAVYAGGGYVLLGGFGVIGSQNYYYGIRRFPKAVISFTGGPNNRPHNPLTFADIDSTQANTTDGAFPAMAGPHISTSADQVHAAGEVWSSALWEVRALMIQRLGGAAGNLRALQVVTDGMKLAPLGPDFLDERDAIIAAAAAASAAPEASADVQDVWEGFRRRGMGFSAAIITPGSGGNTARVTEAFDSPNVVVADSGFAVSDSPGDNDSYPEPGEQVLVTVPVTNATGNTVTSVTVTLPGGSPFNYGDIPDGATVTNVIPYAMSGSATCGGVLSLNIHIDGSAGARDETRTVLLGAPNEQESESFDGVTAPALPAGWTAASTGPGVAFVTKTGTADTAPNSVFAPNTGAAGGNSGSTITSKTYAIAADSGIVRFRNWFNTEDGWDGGVLEISINGGGFQDIKAAGGGFLEGGYTGVLGANQNPLDNRMAWTGNSGGYITTTAWLPASANGANVQFRWRFGEDTNTSNVGWNVDTINVTKSFTCDVAGGSTAPMDFDGDGKTDVSIFRANPSAVLDNAAPEGSSSQWWIYRSQSQSPLGLAFGSPTDVLTPGDFTGDGKTDVAFFRPSDSSWYVLRSEDMTFFAFPFGAAGDIPAPGDFDGDGTTDPAVFRPSNGTWFIIGSTAGSIAVPFGLNGDKPTVADYDGDGKDDVAVYRPSGNEWWQLRSTAGVIGYAFGAAGDQTVVGDYTGDGKADVAFFRPSDASWYVIRSEDSSFYAFPWGASTDIPAPGDYDGDGKSDAAVFRPSNGTWFIFGSTAGSIAVPFGLNGDTPVPHAYVQN
jgi:hypothetical protein